MEHPKVYLHYNYLSSQNYEDTHTGSNSCRNKYSVVADSGGILGLINNIAAEVVDLVDAHAKRITDLQLSGDN